MNNKNPSPYLLCVSASLRSSLFVLTSLLGAFAVIPAFADDPKPTTQQTLEQQFTDRMTNVIMNGNFTIGNGQPKPDKYTIVSVKKLKDDNWQFNARIQFGEKDVTIPLIIPVKWAGDTPVISVTDMTIPLLGTYTARVTIYNDQYAGTWSGGNHAGYMWGKLEKAPTTQPAKDK